MKKTIRLAAAVLTVLPWAGCGGATEDNLSSKSVADPAKLQAARVEADAVASKARAAEAAKTKGAIHVEEP